MHVIARVLAVAYLVLALVAVFVYVQTTITFVNVTEVNLNIGGHVAVSDVEIRWNRSSGTAPRLTVSVTATNPGHIAIEVTNVDFSLHMDDPNDAYPWFDEAGLELTLIRTGGFTIQPGYGVVIPPGATRVVESVVPVDVTKMDAFDRPNGTGRYFPVVAQPRFVYFFVGFDLYNILLLPAYYNPQGVVPVE